MNIKEILKESKWVKAQEDWLEKEVRNPETGNMVKIKSLPPEARKRYRPSHVLKKEFDVPKEHHKAFDKLHEDLKDFVSVTGTDNPHIKNFHSMGGSDYAVIDVPHGERRRMYFHMENKGHADKVYFPTDTAMQYYFKRK